MAEPTPRKTRSLRCVLVLYAGGTGTPLEKSCRRRLLAEPVRVALDGPQIKLWAPEEVVEACNGQRPATDAEGDVPLTALSGLSDKLLRYLAPLRRVLVREGKGRFLLVVWSTGQTVVSAGLVVVLYNGRKHLARMVYEGVWRTGLSLNAAYRDANVAVDVYADFHKVKLLAQQERKNGIVFSMANAFGIVDPETQHRQLKIDYQVEAILFTAALKYQGRNLHYLCTPERNVLPRCGSLWLVSPAIRQEQHANQAARKGVVPCLAAAVQQWIEACPLPASAQAELHRQLAATAMDVPLADPLNDDAVPLDQRLVADGAWTVLAHLALQTAVPVSSVTE